MVLNPIDLTRPNKPEMEGPKTAHEEAVMMRKLYQEIVLKKQLDIKEADKPVQIQGLEPQEAGDCRTSPGLAQVSFNISRTPRATSMFAGFTA
jgi:hypothetical protein